MRFLRSLLARRKTWTIDHLALERVPESVNSANEARLPHRVTDGLSQLCDQARQVGSRDKGVRPQRLVQLVMAEGSWPRLEEHLEQAQRFGRQGDDRPGTGELPPAGVEYAVVEAGAHRR